MIPNFSGAVSTCLSLMVSEFSPGFLFPPVRHPDIEKMFGKPPSPPLALYMYRTVDVSLLRVASRPTPGAPVDWQARSQRNIHSRVHVLPEAAMEVFQHLFLSRICHQGLSTS